MTIKRFIAGAVCPRCSQMDKIRMYREDDKQYRECVSCGFSDVISDDETPTADEIKTRVNQAIPGEQPLPHEDEVQVVNLMDIVQDKNKLH